MQQTDRKIGAEVVITEADGTPCKTPAVTAFDLCKECYAVMKAAHSEIYQNILVLITQNDQRACRLDGLNNSDLVDCGFAIRETATLLEDLHKETKRLLENYLYMRIVATWLMDPLVTTKKIEGKFASGFPRAKEMVAFPDFEKNPVEYNKLMDFFGVDPAFRDKGKEIYADVGEITTEVLKLNFEGFQDYLLRYTANGMAVPDELTCGATAKWMKPMVTIKKKKDLLP